MQTRDHKILGKFLLAEMGFHVPYLYQKAFILGSIEPDKNLFTYLHGLTCGMKFHGHNYENVLSVMRKLFNSMQKQGHFGVRRYYYFGKLIHYTADAFTFPHNRMFQGNLREHCRYERMLHEDFKGVLQKQEPEEIKPKSIDSFRCIEILHREYLKEAGTCEIDCRYILRAVMTLLQSEAERIWQINIHDMKQPECLEIV